MKKFFSFLNLMVLLCLCFTLSAKVYAKNTSISANKSYMIKFGDETKTYIFVMPSSGYFSYSITPIKYIVNGKESDSVSWYLTNTRMKVNYKLYEDTSVKYGSPFKSGCYSFKKGTKIQISLRDSNPEYNFCYYRLRIETKCPKYFEKESNNSRKLATKITLGKTYTGISQQDDKDWWVFTTPKTGKYKMVCVEINDYKH